MTARHALAALTLACALPAHAETASGLGATSTATAVVDLDIVSRNPYPMIEITGIHDIDLGTFAPGEAMAPVSLENICVYMDTPGYYTVRIDFASPSNPFGSSRFYDAELQRGFPYFVRFQDSSGRTFGSDFEIGGMIVNFLTPSSVPGCTDGLRASLTITPQGDQSAGLPSGIYTSQINFYLEPH